MFKKINLIVILAFPLMLYAQPQQEMVEVIIAPDHADWMYKIGENVNFNVQVLRNGNPVEDVEVSYEIMPELMPARESKTINLKNGEKEIKGGTLKEAGFLRLQAKVMVDGKAYEGKATAAFDPLNIQPTVKEPEDFWAFWEEAKSESAKLPLEPILTLMPERCTDKVNVYHVSINNYQAGAKVYGILAVPKAEGKYPAVLNVPGAGVRPYYGDIQMAEEGVITFQIGIHGIPINLDPQVYDNLRYGALNEYWTANLDDKNDYYYKRVYLGCLRAIDLIESLAEYNGKLAVKGGSQGGALSVITAALDERVQFFVSYYPALSDMSGYLHGRAGGWPHMFAPFKENPKEADPREVETASYYDVVNFARHIKVPGYFSWGYNDHVCPPTSTYSVYNVVDAPKQLLLAQETAHWSYPEQREKTDQWLLDQLEVKKTALK
ncbi:acetylxylan esterase [Catalinimonas niigatensis]|uniref:acetylxylan esterase n=1 Tax=Catalinimonas niigatensis TaxID=1397264 RepID=UPI00266573D7|nr:acetylxylan esterase [Catalinimonas niigatensis]WPP51069.1 acetylxylan esterase [Catalinimonas niigatensis]